MGIYSNCELNKTYTEFFNEIKKLLPTAKSKEIGLLVGNKHWTRPSSLTQGHKKALPSDIDDIEKYYNTLVKSVMSTKTTKNTKTTTKSPSKKVVNTPVSFTQKNSEDNLEKIVITIPKGTSFENGVLEIVLS